MDILFEITLTVYMDVTFEAVAGTGNSTEYAPFELPPPYNPR
jgi:hypothetical protein